METLFDKHTGKRLPQGTTIGERLIVETQTGSIYNVRGTPGNYVASKSLDPNESGCQIRKIYQLSNTKIESGSVLEGVSKDQYKTHIKTTPVKRIERV